MNEEHLNIQQWNSKTQNTYNKHVQTKTENQLYRYLVQLYWPVTAHYMVGTYYTSFSIDQPVV